MIKIELKCHFLKSVRLQEPSKQTNLIEEFKNTSLPSLFHPLYSNSILKKTFRLANYLFTNCLFSVPASCTVLS